jgi:hypothetical protein
MTLFLGIMIIASPLLALGLKVISAPHFIPLFKTSTMIAAARASLEVSEPTQRYWQNQLQHQVLSTFTDDTEFNVDLPTGRIANDYTNTGPDAK